MRHRASQSVLVQATALVLAHDLHALSTWPSSWSAAVARTQAWVDDTWMMPIHVSCPGPCGLVCSGPWVSSLVTMHASCGHAELALRSVMSPRISPLQAGERCVRCQVHASSAWSCASVALTIRADDGVGLYELVPRWRVELEIILYEGQPIVVELQQAGRSACGRPRVRISGPAGGGANKEALQHGKAVRAVSGHTESIDIHAGALGGLAGHPTALPSNEQHRCKRCTKQLTP